MSCLIVADEVAARELLVLEHVVEVVARRPRVGQGDEAGVRLAGERQAERGLLVGVQLVGQVAPARSNRSRTGDVGNHGAGAGSGLRCS